MPMPPACVVLKSLCLLRKRREIDEQDWRKSVPKATRWHSENRAGTTGVAQRRVWSSAFRRLEPAKAGTPNFYLLPGFIAGIAARSGGSFVGSKVSTCNEIKHAIGTPKFAVPFERSTTIATPTTCPPFARTMSIVS